MSDSIKFSESERKRIEEILYEKGVKSCPLCNKTLMSTVEGYTMVGIQVNQSVVNLGGRVIPCAMLICFNCGYISHHALGVLGLMEAPKEIGQQ